MSEQTPNPVDITEEIDIGEASPTKELESPKDLSNEKPSTESTTYQNIENSDNYRSSHDLHAEWENITRGKSLTDSEANELRLEDIIGLPSVSKKNAEASIERTPNMQLPNNPQAALWQARAKEAYSTVSADDVYLGSLVRNGSKWTNELNHNGKPLATMFPKLPSTNKSISGEEATLRMAYHLGMGALTHTLLPHSGFYVALKPPSEDQIIEVNRLMINEKIRIGRSTYGLAFTNYTVYTMKILVQFVLSNIYNTTLSMVDNPESKDIGDYIKIQDYPILLNGFAATMYPKGIMYEAPCMVDPTSCLHVEKEVITMTKMQHDDRSALSDVHLTHLLDRRANSKSIREVLQYQNTLPAIAPKEVPLVSSEGSIVYVTLSSPSINEAISHGTEWIDDIVKTVEANAGADVSPQTKENFFIRYSQASEMNHYRHFVKSIRFDDFAEIDNTEDIYKQLATMSQNDGIRKSFVEAVKKFINDSTISVVGVPTYTCKACNGVQPTGQTTDKKEFKEIIPLDVQHLFFGLITRKLLKIMRR